MKELNDKAEQLSNQLFMDQLIYGFSMYHRDGKGKVTRIDPRSRKAAELLQKFSEEKPNV